MWNTLDTSFEDATGEFEYFKIKCGEPTEETGRAPRYCKRQNGIHGARQNIMIEKLDDNILF